MPRVRFTSNIQRHVPCPERTVVGDSVRAVMQGYFLLVPEAEAYVLDDQGGLRPHVVIFVNGQPVQDRSGLSDPLASDDLLDVMQALSGG